MKFSILLFCIVTMQANSQTPKNFCGIRASLASLAKSEYGNLVNSGTVNKLCLVRQFLMDKTDTIYTGFFKYDQDQNIIVANNADYYFHNIQTWIYLDSVFTKEDTIFLWLHNDSMEFIDSIKHYDFQFLFICSTKSLLLISAIENLSYVPLIVRGKIMTPEKGEIEAKKISSFLIRNDFGKTIKCAD